jgi:hypothetical protein
MKAMNWFYDSGKWRDKFKGSHIFKYEAVKKINVTIGI